MCPPLTALLPLLGTVVDFPAAVLVVPLVLEVAEEVAQQPGVELVGRAFGDVVLRTRDRRGRRKRHGDEAEEGECESHGGQARPR